MSGASDDPVQRPVHPGETEIGRWGLSTLPEAARRTKGECLEFYADHGPTAFFRFDFDAIARIYQGSATLSASATTELLPPGVMQILIPKELSPKEAIEILRLAINWLEDDPSTIPQVMDPGFYSEWNERALEETLADDRRQKTNRGLRLIDGQKAAE